MRQIGEYIITHQNISKGAFATIHRGYHCYTKLPVAIKELRVTSVANLKPYVKRELEIHKKLSHPNIVKLYEIISNSTDNIIYLIMEYCEYGDLHKFQAKRQFTEKYVQNYMFQIRDALKYLYDNNIVHRDLKPQNILLSSPVTIKLTDFGLAREVLTQDEDVHEDLFTTYCGSPMYMSPEILHKNAYGVNSDLWSIGIILYELISGTTPYTAINLVQLKAQVSGSFNLDKIDKIGKLDRSLISVECYDLLYKLLNTDKTKRIHWSAFFEHKWFTSNRLIDADNLFIEQPLDYTLLDTGTDMFRHPSLPSLPSKHIQIPIVNAHIINSNEMCILDIPPIPPIPPIPVISPILNNTQENEAINSVLNIEKQKQNLESQQSQQSQIYSLKTSKLISQFTFTLKSSQFSENDSLTKGTPPHDFIHNLLPLQSQHSHNTFDSPIPSTSVNLSDLQQDDIPQNIDYNNYMRPISVSKPIDIKNENNRNNRNITNHNTFVKNSPTNSSSSNTPGTSGTSGTPGTSLTQGSLKNVFTKSYKLIKETYEYLSNNDSNSI